MNGTAIKTLTLTISFLVLGVRLPGSQSREWMKSSSIVFSATVESVASTSFEGAPASADSVVVRVDTVLTKPDSVVLKSGDRVTVGALDPSTLGPGTQAVFYTRGVIFGQGLFVQEVGHQLTGETATEAPATPQTISQMQEEIKDEQLLERMRAAEMVIEGEVTQVRPDSQPAGTVESPARISEHDPDWHEAIVEVTSALKGAEEGQQVVVRFPASRDIQWYFAPKFSEGETGVFILSSDQISGVETVSFQGTVLKTYTAMEAEDVQPASAADRLRRLLEQNR